MAELLRNVEGCDFVIAIAHMRLEEDLLVSNAITNSPGKANLIRSGYYHEILGHFRGDIDTEPGVIQQNISKTSLIYRGRVPDIER